MIYRFNLLKININMIRTVKELIIELKKLPEDTLIYNTSCDQIFEGNIELTLVVNKKRNKTKYSTEEVKGVIINTFMDEDLIRLLSDD